MKSTVSLFTLLFLGFLIIGGCTEKENTADPESPRDAFIGRWSVSETWTKLSYEVQISADPGSSDGVFISNFGNLGSSSTPAGAYVSSTSITLDSDQIIANFTINGSGYLSKSKIYWNYTMNDGATLIQAVAVYTKQ